MERFTSEVKRVPNVGEKLNWWIRIHPTKNWPRQTRKLNQGPPVESHWMINVAINADSEAAP